MNSKKKIKVLMIAPTPFFADRGCHAQIYEEIKALQKLDCEIILCTYHLGRDIPGINIYRSIKIPWYKKTSAGPSWHKIYLDFFLLSTSLKLAFKFKPDVIHGHLHEGALIGWFIKIIKNRPLLFDLQDSLSKEIISYDKKNKIYYPIFYLAEKIINKMPNIIITQSSEMIQDLKIRFKISKEKIFLTFDGSDINRFKPNLDVSNLRKQLNIPTNKKVVIYLGGLTNNKGVHYIIQSIPHVTKKYQNVIFLIMGYPNIDYYQNMAKELGILKHIIFTGQIDYNKAHLYLNLGDIALSPKYTETEANGKLYNYMACGLPVVAFDTGTDREILSDYALYAKKGDVEDYAEKIIFLLENNKIRMEFGKKLREIVVDNYSWDNVGERILKNYNLLLKNKETQEN